VVRGILHRPGAPPIAGLIVTHGRSNDLRNPLVRRIAEATADFGVCALRINFQYVDEKGRASKDLAREEDELRGAVRFLRTHVPDRPIFVVGKSMGARVCARSSADPDIAGVIALGYPLHPQFRPDVRNPPEWPMLVKPTLFIQGDQDPFCNLARLREELPRLTVPHELVVIPRAGHSFESRGERRDTFPEVRDAVFRWLPSAIHQGAKTAEVGSAHL
jgi:uncharacterized protein